MSVSSSQSIHMHVGSIENKVCATTREMHNIGWVGGEAGCVCVCGGGYLLSHLKTEASLHPFYTLTTVLVWKSRSFILCYSLVIDATLN